VSRGVSDPGPGDHLPPWRSILAVVVHPDDESFGLGAVLAGFADAGTAVAVLCFTHGESSTLHGIEGDLASVRAGELAGAARVLGVDPARLVDYPDGALTGVDVDDLSAHVPDLADEVGADGLLVFDTDGVTGHPDHARATLAALAAADSLGLAVLGWTVPKSVAAALNQEYDAAFTGHDPHGIDLVVTLDRTRQLAAVACHPSQAVPGSLLWRRLELLGDIEYLRWLRRPHPYQQKDSTNS
jgi:N-acetylglucosamine malate deacetylase 2